MSLDPQVNVVGEEDVMRALRAAGPRLRKAGANVVATSALNIQREAKQRTPVDTGRLRSSIRATISGDQLGAVVGTDVEYAPFVEHGTNRMQAQPFLFPAFEAERPKFLAALAVVLKQAAEEAG